MKSLPPMYLNPRKQVILKAVVNDYVRTAEPVGSESLAARYQFGVKSATIRNELAELAELGFLHQPHTSAGRVPSDRGYRFYVDRLMDTTYSPVAEAVGAMGRLGGRRTEMELVLEQTCRILSDLARYTSVATLPVVKDARVSYVSVAQVANRKQIVIVVLDNGRVLHEILEIEAGCRPIDPIRATNFLSRCLGGRTLESAAGIQSEETGLMGKLLERVARFLTRELDVAREPSITMEGTGYIVQQPEFKNVERLEVVFSALQQRRRLYKLLSSVYIGEDVAVIIGSENPMIEMHECSFVGANYKIGGRVAGTIGVLGPTRMDYRRAVGAVGFMSRNVGELLTEMSVA